MKEQYPTYLYRWLPSKTNAVGNVPQRNVHSRENVFVIISVRTHYKGGIPRRNTSFPFDQQIVCYIGHMHLSKQ